MIPDLSFKMISQKKEYAKRVFCGAEAKAKRHLPLLRRVHPHGVFYVITEKHSYMIKNADTKCLRFIFLIIHRLFQPEQLQLSASELYSSYCFQIQQLQYRQKYQLKHHRNHWL